MVPQTLLVVPRCPHDLVGRVKGLLVTVLVFLVVLRLFPFVPVMVPLPERTFVFYFCPNLLSSFLILKLGLGGGQRTSTETCNRFCRLLS